MTIGQGVKWTIFNTCYIKPISKRSVQTDVINNSIMANDVRTTTEQHFDEQGSYKT